MADWKKLKKEYIKGGISYRQLAKKYGVPLGTLTRIARRDNWVGLRKQAEDKAATKIVEAVSEESAKIGVDVEKWTAEPQTQKVVLERMTQRLGPCPQNCQDRYANEHEACHSTCQRYMRYKLTKLLEGKQRMKAVDEVGFWRDVGKNLRKKSERKAK